MPVLELSPETFAKLQKLAVPLVDTIDSVINRLIEGYADSAPGYPSGLTGEWAFTPDTIPQLRSTRVVSAKLADQDILNPNWNALLVAVLSHAKESLSFLDLKRVAGVNIVLGRKIVDGYRFYPDIGISVQGQDSNSAARGMFALAQHLEVSLTVEFRWRNAAGVLDTNRLGRIVYEPQL